MMAEGGRWGVPRSGLIFAKRDGALVLVDRAPFAVIAQAASEGLDVPASPDELRVYQDDDYELIRDKFGAAGIPVRSEL